MGICRDTDQLFRFSSLFDHDGMGKFGLHQMPHSTLTHADETLTKNVM